MSDTVKAWIEERKAIHGRSGEYLSVNNPKSVAAIVDAHNMLPRALDALNAVLELHHKERHQYGGWMCTQCTRNHPVQYPCATVQAIEGAINGERG